MIPPRPRDAIELTTRDLTVCREPEPGFAPEVVVAVGVHAFGPEGLTRCLESIVAQCIESSRTGVIILLDAPGAQPFSPELPAALAGRTWLLRANCGSAARARNAILEFVEWHVPSCRWVARMDWDDRFADPASLAAAVAAGEAAQASFVVGGNRVVARDGAELRSNAAGPWLLDPVAVLARLASMADGTAENELPSCNLLLSTRARLRYPDTASAEDHWLVADLLLNRRGEGAILESTLFADYTLNGACTLQARQAQRHRAARRALRQAAATWLAVADLPGRMLGLGQEGIVREHAGVVYKHFYPEILTPEKADWLNRSLASGQTVAPAATLVPGPRAATWIATYSWEETSPFEAPDQAAVAALLAECLRFKLVCGNVKRSNFRVRADGRLVYIDIGNWLTPMDVSVLRDSAARLYSIGVLGASDEELLRRPADHSRPVIWDRLPGFAGFYGRTVAGHIGAHLAAPAAVTRRILPPRRTDVTLLIKACAMDAGYAREQIRHIVDQFVGPTDFAERLLVIDTYPGPFLRQHAAGDPDRLRAIAHALRDEGVLDRVLVSPADPVNVRALNMAWFGHDSAATHSVEGIPIVPQLWGFEQVTTRYVLQCDLDILVGRRDANHDYLAEMLEACAAPDVVSVGFNIPRAPNAAARPSAALPGEFKPEVRCGLLDLERLRALRPLPNTLLGGRLAQPWYRSLHERQRHSGLKSLRGGDPRTFYLHPLNELKCAPENLSRIRDLVGQGLVPASQWERWDVGPEDAPRWRYPTRSEPVIVLARGRNTPPEKIERFAAGLAMQDDPSFGVIVIDDASDDASPNELLRCLGFLGTRLTLVRHGHRRGRMANVVLAVRSLCTDPASCIVTVDLDDALADPGTVTSIRSLRDRGHDVILAAPFRPDAPTKVYQPNFHEPRNNFGGDVWIHLRAFEKHLFDRAPDSALRMDGDWLDECEDYATMMAVVESAKSPVYVPEYWYLHERATGHTCEEQGRRDSIMRRLLAT